jgi:hypothetical protein
MTIGIDYEYLGVGANARRTPLNYYTRDFVAFSLSVLVYIHTIQEKDPADYFVVQEILEHYKKSHNTSRKMRCCT